MFIKINNSIKFGKQQGGFGIEILYPGIPFPEINDTGIATLGRIDHAHVMPGTLIPMHPHSDDEILTYLRSGKVKHNDSEGLTDIISAQRLMLMNAGKIFYHEELSLVEGGVLRGLQIFIRPEEHGLESRVQFHDFQEVFSVNQWRKVAGKDPGFPLTFRSATWIYDIRMTKGIKHALPPLPIENASLLFYVFEGEVRVNNGVTLKNGESQFMENEQPEFTALTESDVVLFVTDKKSQYTEKGMYSGNQTRGKQ